MLVYGFAPTLQSEGPMSPMPQVKFTQQNWHDRLTTILDDFPKVS